MKKTNDNYSFLSSLAACYADSKCIAESFGGPSIYFHNKALEWQIMDFLSERHLEYVYATLTSWGMHRMGEKGAKMPDFDEFRKSIEPLQNKLTQWKNLKIEVLTEDELKDLLPKLTDVCFLINASKSESHVVSGSKTLAHILPNLVCPMDRNYTLKFFRKSISSKDKDKQEEKEKLFFTTVMKTMWEFYHSDISKDITIADTTFQESYPKIFDNLLIAFIKNKKNNNNKEATENP